MMLLLSDSSVRKRSGTAVIKCSGLLGRLFSHYKWLQFSWIQECQRRPCYERSQLYIPSVSLQQAVQIQQHCRVKTEVNMYYQLQDLSCSSMYCPAKRPMQNYVSWRTSRNADSCREFYGSMLYDALWLTSTRSRVWALPFAWDFHHEVLQGDFLWSHEVNTLDEVNNEIEQWQ